ncbi:MAG: hypothetical protein DRJ69_07455 [Thermoprotei archaeon]|nr:MAG: hypothetical protein DRJ69_07455 [Thermoprotei archaeon]
MHCMKVIYLSRKAYIKLLLVYLSLMYFLLLIPETYKYSSHKKSFSQEKFSGMKDVMMLYY